MKFCISCGSELAGRRFCGQCGAAIPEPDPGAASADAGTPVSEQAEQPGQWWDAAPPPPAVLAWSPPPPPAPAWSPPPFEPPPPAPSFVKPPQAPIVPDYGSQPTWSGREWAQDATEILPPATGGYDPAAPTWSGPAAAGFGRRLGALIVDSAIIAVFVAVLAGVAAAVRGAEGERLAWGPYNELGVFVLTIAAGSAIAALLLRVLGEGGRAGATPGKRLMGIRVVRADGVPAPVGYGRAFGRYLAHALDSLLYLSSLSMLWDRQGRTWHDKLSGTSVVHADAGAAGPAAWPAAALALGLGLLVGSAGPVAAALDSPDAAIVAEDPPIALDPIPVAPEPELPLPLATASAPPGGTTFVPPTTLPAPTQPPPPTDVVDPVQDPAEEPEASTQPFLTPGQFLSGYYALLPGDTDSAWALLTTSYQASSGGRESFDEFYGGISIVEIVEGPTEIDELVVRAQLRFVTLEGSESFSDVEFTLVPNGDSYLIDATALAE